MAEENVEEVRSSSENLVSPLAEAQDGDDNMGAGFHGEGMGQDDEEDEMFEEGNDEREREREKGARNDPCPGGGGIRGGHHRCDQRGKGLAHEA